MANDEESNIAISLDHLDVSGNLISDGLESPTLVITRTTPSSSGNGDGSNVYGLRAPSVLSRTPSFLEKLRSRTDLTHVSILNGHDGNGGILGVLRRLTATNETVIPAETDPDVAAAREEFFRVILDQQDASRFVDWEHYKWYFNFLECRFTCGWETLRGSLRGVVELSPDPRPGEFAVVYKAMTVVAKVLMEEDRCALSDIVDKLMHAPHMMLRDQEDDRALPNQMVFAMLGWLTMLFEPDLHPPKGGVAIRRLDSPSSTTRRARTRTLTHYTQDFSRVDNQFCILLSHFGTLVPSITISPAASTSLITVSNVCFAALDNIAAVRLEWVNSLSMHLEFDSARKTLKLFRFPSFCRLLATDSPLLSQLYRDHARAFARERAPTSPYPSTDLVAANDFFREVLLSYRLLFGQDSKSHRAFVARSAHWDPDWASSAPGLHDADPLLRVLCAGPSSSPAARALYAELDAEDDESQYYYTDAFPFLGRRILELQAFVNGRQPHNWLSLWRDRRNVAYWWTFWAVLFIGGGTIALGLVQVAVGVWQAWASQRQIG